MARQPHGEGRVSRAATENGVVGHQGRTLAVPDLKVKCLRRIDLIFVIEKFTRQIL